MRLPQRHWRNWITPRSRRRPKARPWSLRVDLPRGFPADSPKLHAEMMRTRIIGFGAFLFFGAALYLLWGLDGLTPLVLVILAVFAAEARTFIRLFATLADNRFRVCPWCYYSLPYRTECVERCPECGNQITTREAVAFWCRWVHQHTKGRGLESSGGDLGT